MGVSDKIKNNAKEIKDGTYGSNLNEKSKYYKTGAIVGAISGFVVSQLIKGRVILYTAIGAVAGGYIGYKIAENAEPKSEFSNFSKK